ncbi:polycystic kidney disease and receptor for egg jelly-related protein [Cricetulus griseus]|uniref:Polycystin family receptor for egg jelly n=1 Tax=Cricetulus griseus TaxID=10029 RepID=A0A3L7IAN9_CRIGR|nr:polycystic kidney disease and receptor for egg jelly-related protein [Cricetulus griseus]ERE86471.1 polycystic kidney disease and receptor for egg jelly-related protein [Cricetulus griseus]
MWPGPALLLLGLGLGLGRLPSSPGPRGLLGVLRGAPGLGQDEESRVRGGGTGGLSPRTTAPRRAGPKLPHKCPSGAPARVLLKVNSSNPAAATATVSCQMTPCNIQSVKINRKDQHAPLILSRKEEVTLNVTVLWDCPEAMIISKTWLYYLVASVNDTPDWNRPVQLPQVREMKLSSIHIPKSALPYGVYVFNFTLSIIRWNPTLPTLRDSDSVYIWVKKPPLKAILLPGATDMTINFSDELILNGSMSSDPEVDIPTEGLHFSWYCTTNPIYYVGNYVQVTHQDVCHPEQDTLNWLWAVGPVLTIPPETLRGNGVYYFRMVIQKQNRIAFADKIVRVLKGLLPKAHISCIENCGPTLVVSDRFSLFLNCTGCASQDLYSWSILSRSGHEMMFDWAGQAVTRRNGAYLSMKAFAFRNFSEAGFWVSLYLTSWSGATLNLHYPFAINHGPQVGKCKINPAKGISMVTKFVVECSDFKDKNLPLKYKIIVAELDNIGEISSVEENTLGTIAYSGTQSTTPAFFLPVGVMANHYSLKLYAQVYDSLGTFSQVTLQATVQGPTVKDSPKTVLRQLLNFITNPSSPLATLLQKQDWLPAGYLMYVVASVLNNIQRELALQNNRAYLLEHLVNQSFVPALGTLDQICQVVMVITKLTQEASDYSQAASVGATLRLWQANKALQAYQRRNKHVHSRHIEIVGTGILTSLSNILMQVNPHYEFQDPFFIVESLSDTILANKVPGSETTVLRTSSFNMYVEKAENSNVSKVFRNETRCPNCLQATLNTSRVPGLPPKAPISVMFCEFTNDPFPWLTYPENISASVVGFRMTEATDNGSVIEITPDVAEVYLVRKDLTFASFNLMVGPGIEGTRFSKMTTGGISFEVDSRGTGQVLIHIVTKVTVLFKALIYVGSQVTPTNLVATFLVPHDIPPTAKWSSLLDSTCPVKEARVICLPSSLLRILAQRSHSFKYNISMLLQAPRFVFKPTNKLVRIALFMVHCLDMYGIQSDWKEGTCVLGEKTTWKKVHCICRNVRRSRRQLASMKLHLHIHFVTAKVIVVPNPVDLQLQVIRNLYQNPVTFLVVLFIMILYGILAFWALHRDAMDQYLRDHVVVLPDNDPFDSICYLVTVFTGSRFGSGTRANVFIQLMGTERTSDVHCLSHPYFITLYRGSINTFLLTTKNDLGDIHSIRVWHDNEGKAPSWYLSRIKVENLFSRRIWLFLCRRWLSVDTTLNATFSATNPDESLKRIDFFLIDLSHKLSKNHMWFSVFSDIVPKSYNRLQRLSCCLAMLLSSLVCNIMFFNLNRKGQTESRERRIIRSMMIGIESVLITIPVQLLITFFFTYSQKKPPVNLDKVVPQTHPLMSEEGLFWKERLDKWHEYEMKALDNKAAESTSAPRGKPLKRTFKTSRKSKKTDSKGSDTPKSNSNFSNNNVEDSESGSLKVSSTQLVTTQPVKNKTQILLPMWCVYIAWFLVFATSGISSFLIVFYGLTYGYDKSVEWLFTSFCSFCQSVFLVQPSKILLWSGIRTKNLKYCKNLSWSSKYRYTEIRLQEARMSPEELQQLHEDMNYLRGSSIYQPITEDKIQILRRKKRIRRRSLLFLSYLVTHFIFLALLLLLIVSLHHNDSFYYNQFIRQQFSMDLATVMKLGDIYTWLNSVLLPLLHNDLNPTFLPDSSSKILGLPLMRQVRAKPSNKTCLLAKKFGQKRIAGEIHCHPQYGIDPEDTKSYSSVWNKAAKQSTGKPSNGFTYKPPGKKWVYHSSGVLNTYRSGGYAFYFFPTQQSFNSTLRLKELEGKNWLDEMTWAVIVELTTLNPDTSLMCSISVVFEVSPLGVVNSSLSVYSFSLADFSRENWAEIYLYVAILIFFCAYVVDEGYIIMHERASYLRSVYNLLNFSLKCMFTLLIVLFFQKYLLATSMVQLYLTDPKAFIPFHAISQVDHFIRITLAFLLFLTTLKTLRYSRFFYDVRLAQKAIQAALPGIFHMALVVSMYSFMYVAFGYLVFGQHEWNYSSMIHATQTIFSYCVSAFQNTEFSSNKVLGVLFLSSFMLVMICIFINLFQAVILSAYDEMKQPVYEEPSDEAEAITYLFDNLRSGFDFLTSRSRDKDQSEFFVDMMYGQPEKNNRRFLGLKTRNINGKKMVYLVV